MERATLREKLIAKGNQACVAHYHRSTNFDDWGTLNEHWELETEESPAKGYINRFFKRVKVSENGVNLSPDNRHNRTGTICVTYLNGEMTPDIEWYIRPTGCYAHPEEDYIHADELPKEPLVEKPAGYGAWA